MRCVSVGDIGNEYELMENSCRSRVQCDFSIKMRLKLSIDFFAVVTMRKVLIKRSIQDNNLSFFCYFLIYTEKRNSFNCSVKGKLQNRRKKEKGFF